jgi:hypothetical protein
LSQKRFINLSDRNNATAWRFYPQPLPLAAIYILGERQPDVTCPKIEPISPPEAVMQLMAQRSLHDLPLDQDRQGREFAGLSRVAMTVPVRKVIRGDSLEAFAAVVRCYFARCDWYNDIGEMYSTFKNSQRLTLSFLGSA